MNDFDKIWMQYRQFMHDLMEAIWKQQLKKQEKDAYKLSKLAEAQRESIQRQLLSGDMERMREAVALVAGACREQANLTRLPWKKDKWNQLADEMESGFAAYEHGQLIAFQEHSEQVRETFSSLKDEMRTTTFAAHVAEVSYRGPSDKAMTRGRRSAKLEVEEIPMPEMREMTG